MTSIITLTDRRDLPLLYRRVLQRIESLEGRINGLWRTDISWVRMTGAAPLRELFTVITSDSPGIVDMVGVAPGASPPVALRADASAMQLILDACPNTSSNAVFEARAALVKSFHLVRVMMGAHSL